MDENLKDRYKKALDQHKAGVRAVREALMGEPLAEEARKQMHQAELSVLQAMYEISWIGLDREGPGDDDNPSV